MPGHDGKLKIFPKAGAGAGRSLAYIAAGELAGERVAGLVEEDGDELERREQERPPQLQNNNNKRRRTPQTVRPRRAKTPTPPGVAREENEATGERENRWRRRRRGGTHEEDDDGGDADGRDEDPLVTVAASPQLPVHVHRHPRPPPL